MFELDNSGTHPIIEVDINKKRDTPDSVAIKNNPNVCPFWVLSPTLLDTDKIISL